MGILRSQGGAALITALMLTMLALVIALALLTMVTTGTQVSSSQKRYRSSLTAAQGGVELLTREIMPRLFEGVAAGTLESHYSLIGLQLPEDGCLRQKLDLSPAGWTLCTGPVARHLLPPGGAPPVTGFQRHHEDRGHHTGELGPQRQRPSGRRGLGGREGRGDPSAARPRHVPPVRAGDKRGRGGA